MKLAPVFALILAGCTSNTPAPLPLLSGSISPSAAWSVTQGSQHRALSNGALVFQQCPSAFDCWDSYIEVPLAGTPDAAQTFTLNYTISGDNPTFVNDTESNTCGGLAALSLILHQAGDNMSGLGAYESYRWFSVTALAEPLTLGIQVISVPLVLADWINVVGQSTDSAGFANALTHMGSVGFVLGGGCFAGHGVAVSSGSATLQINSVSIQ